MTSTAVEEWRPIAGYEGIYDVSNTGSVRSWTKAKRGGLLAPAHDSDGYLVLGLSRSGRAKRHKVHRLVLEAFVGPKPAGLICRHLNGIKTDNRLTNLAYGTYSENLLDAVAHGTHAVARRTACANGHAFTAENTVLRPDGRTRKCLACERAANRRKSGVARTKRWPYSSRARVVAALTEAVKRLESDGQVARPTADVAAEMADLVLRLLDAAVSTTPVPTA
jgi:hypothetical protein